MILVQNKERKYKVNKGKWETYYWETESSNKGFQGSFYSDILAKNAILSEYKGCLVIYVEEEKDKMRIVWEKDK